MKSISRLSSGRVVVKAPAQVDDDRYQLLDLASAEPNLGTAANGSVLATTTTGQRVWTKNLSINNATVSANLVVGSVYTNNLLFANGDPYISETTESNIYNGNVTVGTSVTLVDTVASTGVSSVRWTITARDTVNGTLRSSTIDSVNDGTDTYYNEYGVVLSDNSYEVAVFTSNISAGAINLYALGESASVVLTYQRTTLGDNTVPGYVAGIASGGPAFTGTVSGNLSVLGTTFVTGDIIPTSNNTVNIGSPTQRFGTLYLAANTIDLGGTTISTTPTGDLSFATSSGIVDITANTVNFLNTVASTEVAPGSLASAGYTGSAGAVGYTGSKGNTGLGFKIAKSYLSVAALTADTAPTGIVAGEFALIETGDVSNTDNSKLYLWSGTAYSYVNDLSGAAGITGPAGTTGFTGSAGANGFTGSIGFTGSAAPLNIPVVNSAVAYTLTASDIGDYVNITTGGVTVPSGVFSSGDVISIYNNSASNQTITQGAGVTMYLVGTATTGNRTLAQRGLATILCVGSNEFVITGGGLT